MLEGKPFKEVLTQPHLRISQPGRLVRRLPICLMSFICSSRQWLSRKSELGVCSQDQDMQTQKAWFRFFSTSLMASIASRVLPYSSWKQLLHILEDSAATVLVLHL